MNNAQQTSQDFAAAQQLDGAEYLCRFLDGVLIYEERDELVLDMGDEEI